MPAFLLCTMKKTLFTVFVSSLLIQSVVADSSVVIDWSEAPVGSPPVVGENHLAFLEHVDGVGKAEIIDGTSPLPNPFLESPRALLIEQANQKGRSVVPVFDFYGAQPLPKGTLTMKVMLLRAGEPGSLSGLNIILAPEATPDLARTNMASGFARIRLTGDFSAQVMVPATSASPIACEPRTVYDKPYDVRIDWDLTTTPAYFTVHVDGIPVSDQQAGQKGEATRFELVDLPSNGIGAVMLMPRSTTSSYIIGRMEMGASIP